MTAMDHDPLDRRTPGEPSPADAETPAPPLITSDAAARALRDYFLANAERSANAANDELVAELVRRIRALQASRVGGC